MKAVLTALALIAVGLAGCTDDGVAPARDIDTEGFEFAQGTGAVAGLLVDDRFRPIQLTDDPQTEFQTTGFVLLQETGERAQTTENGEFFFVDLPPGSYTIRVQADGHEAVPTQVRVSAGEFAESSIVARRTSDAGGVVITQEHAIFIDCWYINPVFRHTEVNCFADLSRDSKRGALRGDYSHMPDVTYMVAEFLMNQVGDYDVDVGFGEGEAVQEVYARANVRDGDYGRLLLTTDKEADVEAVGADGILDNERSFIAVLWPVGSETEVPGVFAFGIATKAQVLVSLFLGEPDGDVTAYCALCE